MTTMFKYSLITLDKNLIRNDQDNINCKISFRTHGMIHENSFSFKKTVWYESYFKKGLFQNLFSLQDNLPFSGILPPAVKYHVPGIIVFERPPSYQMVQYAPTSMGEISEDTEIKTYRIAIPWQLYIVSYNSDYFLCNNVKMFFMNSSLNFIDQPLYMPTLPNFYTNGSLCRPMYASMAEVDGYAKNLSGILSSAYDWVWNSGFNHDLTENLHHLAKIQKTPFVLAESCSFNSWSHNYRISPENVSLILNKWQSIDMSDILKLQWPNPSLTTSFDNDASWYYENDPDRFDIDTDEENWLEDLPVMHSIQQTYEHVMKAVLIDPDYSINLKNATGSFYRNMINSFNSIEI